MAPAPQKLRRRIYLHVGTHKTGTTSAQAFLGSRREMLAGAGIRYYRGAFSLDPDNHVDLARACLDPQKQFFGDWNPNVRRGEATSQKIRESVRAFLESNSKDTIIFSSEDVSLLRSNDEFVRLAQLLDPIRNEVFVVLVTRDPADFLKSYAQQIFKVPGRLPSEDPRSALYVEADTWLTDWDALTAGFERRFGAAEIRRLDYDAIMAAERDVLPSLLRALGLPESLIPAPGSVAWRNVSAAPPATRSLRRIGARILRRVLPWP